MPPLDPFPLFVLGGWPFNGKLKTKLLTFYIHVSKCMSMDSYCFNFHYYYHFNITVFLSSIELFISLLIDIFTYIMN